MEGYKDPFNRRTYPWGREDGELMEHFRQLGSLKKLPALRDGDIEFVYARDGKLLFHRTDGEQKILIYVNHSPESWDIPTGQVLYSKGMHAAAPKWFHLDSMGFAIIQE